MAQNQFQLLFGAATGLFFLISGIISNNQSITIIGTGLLTTNAMLTNHREDDQNSSISTDNNLPTVPLNPSSSPKTQIPSGDLAVTETQSLSTSTQSQSKSQPNSTSKPKSQPNSSQSNPISNSKHKLNSPQSNQASTPKLKPRPQYPAKVN